MLIIILVSKVLAENDTGFIKVRKLAKELGVLLLCFCCSLLPDTPRIGHLAELMLMPDINFIIQSPIQEQHGL